MFDPKPVNINPDSILKQIFLFISYLRKKALLFGVLVLLALSASFVWYYFSKPTYTAKCSFVLEEKTGGVSGLAGIASQMGIDIGALAGGSGSFFSGENITDIINSSTILDDVLLSKVDSSTTLADLYLSASGMKNSWGWKSKLNGFSFSSASASASNKSLFDTTLLVVRAKIKKKNLQINRTNKKGTIYSVEVTSSNQQFAKLLTERLVTATGNLYVDIKTRNITSHIAQLEKRADSLRQLFGTKARESYSLQLLDANAAFKSNLASSEISIKDKTVVFELYAEVMKNLELSHLLLINQTPVVQVLDKPEEPLVDTRYSLIKLLAMSAGVAIVLGLLISIINYKAPE
jgi:hypothetical protein